MIKIKTCFKCGKLKKREEFYPHKDMKDGTLNKCKECAKKDSRKHRRDRLIYYRDYDKERNKSQQRRNERNEYCKEYRMKNPEKYKAHGLLYSAIKRGQIRKDKKCNVCGKKGLIEGHHPDYKKPLEVIWLCTSCHRRLELSKEKEEVENIKKAIKEIGNKIKEVVV